MNFWGHNFQNFKSVERICWACGYVTDRGLDEKQTKAWIKREEGCELHCGGAWHTFQRVASSRPERVGLLDPGIDGPYNELCEHKSAHDGPRIEARWGTVATQICDCGMWRTMHHKPGPWQPTPIPQCDRDTTGAQS